MAFQTCLLGFPPADDQVREFLTHYQLRINKNAAETANIRARRFLKALFLKTAACIANLDVSSRANRTRRRNHTSRKVDIIEKFREFMSEGQSMGTSGHKRREFYESVIVEAKVRRACISLLILSNSPALFSSIITTLPTKICRMLLSIFEIESTVEGVMITDMYFFFFPSIPYRLPPSSSPSIPYRLSHVPECSLVIPFFCYPIYRTAIHFWA